MTISSTMKIDFLIPVYGTNSSAVLLTYRHEISKILYIKVTAEKVSRRGLRVVGRIWGCSTHRNTQRKKTLDCHCGLVTSHAMPAYNGIHKLQNGYVMRAFI